MAILDPLRSIYHRLTREKPASYVEVERAERMFYLTYLREGMVAFDVGANFGELTTLFSRFTGVAGRVHAFEPSPAAFAVLQTLAGVNARGNIVLNQLAVSDEEGSLTLHVYAERHAGLTSAVPRNLDSVAPAETIEVPTTTLTAYCRAHAIDTIDLLKIDVEGFEYKALLGARELFRERRVRCCVFEYGSTTHDAGVSADELEAFFGDVSYGVKNLIDGASAFPGRARPETAPFSMHVARPS